MKIKDKNTLVLIISAALIVLAVIIAIISFSVEKARIEKNTPSTEAVEKQESKDDKPASSDKSDKVDDTTKQDTQVPDTTKPVAAGDNVPGKYKVATQNDPLGVRLTPESEAERIYEIQKGSEVAVLCTYKDWAFVKVDNVSGWVAKQYLELIEKSDAPTHATGKYIIGTKDDPLGIRVKPESDAERNGEVPKGATVEILTVCGEWGYVEYEGKTGWLSFEYLKAE